MCFYFLKVLLSDLFPLHFMYIVIKVDILLVNGMKVLILRDFVIYPSTHQSTKVKVKSVLEK